MITKKELCNYLHIPGKDEKTAEILALYTHLLNDPENKTYLERLHKLGFNLNDEQKSLRLEISFTANSEPDFSKGKIKDWNRKRHFSDVCDEFDKNGIGVFDE